MIESVVTLESLKRLSPHLQEVEGDRMVLAWGDAGSPDFVVTCAASANEPGAIQRFDQRLSEAFQQAQVLFADDAVACE